jgi:hypothetical protein
MSETADYQPMVNDRHEFNPMGAEWSYILDSGNDGPAWRALVAKNMRYGTWPFAGHGHTGRRGGPSYHHARLSPDWVFYSWGSEYVGASWDEAEPSIVKCRLVIGRDYGDDYTGHVVIDLRAKACQPWLPCQRGRERGIPADVAAEAEHKAAKLLAFFLDAIMHWKAGDQERPVQAADIYTQNGGK